ncbi:MAG TPA: hypothetical protein VHK24_02070 [Steroidobacter sp.]|jgi:hypothetical protein|nr:hypothetical protein [Steroidobacter sp.]
MTLHLVLKEEIERRYADRLREATQLSQDAIVLKLMNGAVIEFRWANEREYAVSWRWGDAMLRIDTAPLHPELATFPNHLHDADGALRADPITQCGADPLENAGRLIDALAADPMLRPA